MEALAEADTRLQKMVLYGGLGCVGAVGPSEGYLGISGTSGRDTQVSVNEVGAGHPAVFLSPPRAAVFSELWPSQAFVHCGRCSSSVERNSH